MYTLIKSIAVLKEAGSRWEEVDPSLMTMETMFSIYRAGYLTLESTMLVDRIYVDINSLRDSQSANTDTLTAYLASIGNAALPTVAEIPVLNPKYAKWEDAFRAGYQIDLVKPGVPLGNVGIPLEDKTWVRMHRENTLGSELYDNCLISINGFYHRTDTDGENLFVVDGGKSLFKSRQNQVGMWSFKSLGGVECVPITESMIMKGESNLDFKTRLYIDSGIDLSDRYYFLVLGGYVHFPDGQTLWQLNSSTLGVNVSKLPLAERYQESFPYLDFSELLLDTRADSPTVVDVAQLYSDEKLVKYLTMSQSFIVVLNKKDIFRNKLHVRAEPLPGMFLTYTEPKYPLIVGNGKVAEYWKTLEDGYWNMRVQDSYLQNKVFSTLDFSEQTLGWESNETMVPYYNSPGYLLELGSDF